MAMHRVVHLLLLSVVAAQSPPPPPKGRLIVCVQEARSLADMDDSEKPGTEGSDAFVAIFVGGMPDAATSTNDEAFYTTTPVRNRPRLPLAKAHIRASGTSRRRPSRLMRPATVRMRLADERHGSPGVELVLFPER